MGPTPGWGRPGTGAGRNRSQIIVIGVVALLILYAISRAHSVSSFQILFFVMLVPSIILHEVSHGWVALAFGDDTAKRAGRLTLNPLRHIDPIGTVILPVILILSGVGAFGYAKPVPVNVRRLRSPRNQSLLVSLAGPAVNIVLMLAALLALRVAAPAGTVPPSMYVAQGYIPSSLLWEAFFAFGLGNMILAVFNLLPLPPLDGSALLERAMPRSWWPGYLRVRMYAMPVLIVVVLLFSPIRSAVGTWALRAWGDLLG
ncbi:MAG: site-2 protease family protein [Acidimicrobiales bacterium]